MTPWGGPGGLSRLPQSLFPPRQFPRGLWPRQAQGGSSERNCGARVGSGRGPGPRRPPLPPSARPAPPWGPGLAGTRSCVGGARYLHAVFTFEALATVVGHLVANEVGLPVEGLGTLVTLVLSLLRVDDHVLLQAVQRGQGHHRARLPPAAQGRGPRSRMAHSQRWSQRPAHPAQRSGRTLARVCPLPLWTGQRDGGAEVASGVSSGLFRDHPGPRLTCPGCS